MAVARKMAWPPRLPCSRCFLLLCFFLLVASGGAGRVVTSLPGFDGRLPFHLETGYVEVGEASNNGDELFYYFVQAESSEPAAAPFVLWLTGGRRCSVLSGLAYEIGPVRFVLEPYHGTLPRLHYNTNSWTKVSHILFVDSPVGAGFSFSREPKGYDGGDISSSLRLHEFLLKWFNDHPEYLANPFYVGGDSYAGKLVPFLAQIISEGIEAGMKTVPNLKGYLVGNPVTGESIDSSSKVPFAHGYGLISDQLYETLSEHCQGEEHTNPASALCAQATDALNNLLAEVGRGHVLLDRCVFASPATNAANISSDDRKILREEIGVGQQLHHPPARPAFHCFEYRYYLSYFWANDRRTRDALGIKEGTVDEWVRCHDAGEVISDATDIKSSIKYHRNVTSRGYRALVYSGDHDPVVPHLGTQAWVRSLNFSVADDWRAWHLDGQAAGFTISYSNNMTFATIKGGGHTAPEYEPDKCFAMFSRWILNRPL